MLDPSERLRNAVVEGNLSITKRILHKYPELWLNINSKNGWNNLHYSSHNGNYLICYHLVSFINQFKDVNVELSNILANHNDMLSFDGLSAVHLTIKSHHLQTLHYLLQEFPGAYWLNHKGGKHGQTPLHFCCIYGFPEGMKLLLEKGADYNLCDDNDNNLLHLAFEYGNFECIKVFLEFLYHVSSNYAANSKTIRAFERAKNANGWLPIELSIDFKLTNHYKSFKKKLLVNITGSEVLTNSTSTLNSTIASTFVKSTSPLSSSRPGSRSNSTSASMLPTVSDNESVNLNDKTIKLEFEDESTDSNSMGTTSFNNSPGSNKVLASPILSMNEFKRAHSQSLPTQAEEELPSILRQRANTTIAQHNGPGHHHSIPNHQNHQFMPPSTPVIQKTPSLKSFTISPSIRLNTENDPDNIDLESATSVTSSPVKHSFPVLKTAHTGSPVTSIAGTRSAQTLQALQNAGSFEEEAVVDSPSSIAAKIAFNSSKSSRSSTISSRNRSRNNSGGGSPVKNNHSSATINSRSSHPSSTPVPLTPPQTSHSSTTVSGSPSKSKPSISSISFSRIR